MLANDLLGASDRGCVALRGEARTFLAEEFLYIDVAIVNCIDQLPSRSAGHSAADRPVIDEDHSSVFACGTVSP